MIDNFINNLGENKAIALGLTFITAVFLLFSGFGCLVHYYDVPELNSLKQISLPYFFLTGSVIALLSLIIAEFIADIKRQGTLCILLFILELVIIAAGFSIAPEVALTFLLLAMSLALIIILKTIELPEWSKPLLFSIAPIMILTFICCVLGTLTLFGAGMIDSFYGGNILMPKAYDISSAIVGVMFYIFSCITWGVTIKRIFAEK